MKIFIQTRRHLTSLLLIIALILNAIAPLFITFNATPAFADSNTVLICTAEGFKYISLDDFEKGTLPDNSKPKPHCPLCVINSDIVDEHFPSVVNLKEISNRLQKVQFYAFTTNHMWFEAISNSHSRAPPHIL